MGEFTKLSVIIFLVLLAPSGQAQNSRTSPYQFNGDHLAMTLAEFRTTHRTHGIQRAGYDVECHQPKESIMWCYYAAIYPSGGSTQVTRAPRPNEGIVLAVSTMFVDSKLALIMVKTPDDNSDCFEAPPAGGSALYFYNAACLQYPSFWQALTGGLGTPERMSSTLREGLTALRWENDASVAEFQEHLCWPYEGGWSKRIPELLEGRSYCGAEDTLSYRETIMLYLHKGLCRSAVWRLPVGTAN